LASIACFFVSNGHTKAKKLPVTSVRIARATEQSPRRMPALHEGTRH